MRKFKFLLSIIIVTIGGYMLYQFIQDNTSEKKLDYQVQSAEFKADTSAEMDSSESNNFSVLVESPIYNAVVSLDEVSKEFRVKLLDDVSDSDKDKTSHYIKLSDADIDSLIANADTLFNQFENGGILDKYNMVTNMLKSYDTNIDQGDLIGVALNFIK